MEKGGLTPRGGTVRTAQSRNSALRSAAELAQERLLSVKGDPFLFADWERVVFLHFIVAPELLRRFVPRPFELELYESEACISLVHVTMRRFRPCRPVSLGWLFRPITQQRFLNLRTYVHSGSEPGALFLWGWLSQPFPLRLPSAILGLPYSFASLDYEHDAELSVLHGAVSARNATESFAYRAAIAPHPPLAPCSPGSLAEFAMERYSGFFCRGPEPRVFRAWHPPWLQTPIDATIEDASLVTNKFPSF